MMTAEQLTGVAIPGFIVAINDAREPLGGAA